MANIVNQYGQVKVGVRVQSSPLMSTLMNSLYSVYNADSVGLTSLKTSLYSAYNGESNANDSFGSNNGTAQGGLTYAAGKIGNAFSFNGTNAYVSLPNNSLNFTGDFSFSLWMNRKSAVQANILSNFYNGATPYGWWLSITNGTISFNMGKGTSTFLCNITTPLLGANVWQLITITKSASSVKMYVDGVLKNSATITGNVVYTTTHYPMIGAAKYDTGSPVGFLENGCLIDGLNIWQKELTQSEITDLYNSGNGSQYITDSFYKPTTNDALGTNNGTAQGGLTYTPGKIGTAFSFNGTNAIVEYPANSMNLTGDFTISFWTYMRSRDTNVIMSNYGNDGINRGFYIDSDGSYALRFVGNYLAPYYSLIKTDNSALFDMNVWMHFTFISKNGVGQWYKNGVANGASGNVMTNGYITNNKPIIGGFRSGNAGTIGSNKNMMLDAFTIWNKALTTTEITELYNSGNGKQYPN